VNEQQRPVIEQEIAAEPALIRTELDFIRSQAFGMGIQRDYVLRMVCETSGQHVRFTPRSFGGYSIRPILLLRSLFYTQDFDTTFVEN
jgi:hypothetical protein